MKATNYTTAGQPESFFLFVGNSMYECRVTEKREKAVKVQRTAVAFDGSLVESKKDSKWYPKSGLMNTRDDEYELAKWV